VDLRANTQFSETKTAAKAIKLPFLMKEAPTRLDALRDGSAFCYLTSNDFEDAENLGPAEFRALGIEGGTFQGKWHPIQERMAAYLGEDSIDILGGDDNPTMKEHSGKFGCNILLGHTVLYAGKQWLAPTMEVQYGSQSKSFWPTPVTREDALAAAKWHANYLAERVAGIGGVVLDVDIDDECLLVPILIPMEWAEQHKDFYDYKKDLEKLFGYV